MPAFLNSFCPLESSEVEMETPGNFDLVVIGEHPAALWVARQLLLREKKVLILPTGVQRGANAIPAKVAADFGWKERDLPDPGKQSLQVLTSGRRFSIRPEESAFEEECHFQFGKEWKSSPHLSSVLRGLAYFARGNDGPPVSTSDWDLWRDRALEMRYWDRESGYLGRKMLQSLADLGAKVAKPKQLKQIFLDRTTLVGVHLQGSSKMIPVRAGICAVPFGQIRAFSSEPVQASDGATGWVFETRFECSPDSLPAGIGSRMAFVDGDAPVLEVIHEGAGKFRMKTVCSMEERSFSRAFQRRLATRMLKACESFIPDLAYNLKGAVPDLRDPEKAEAVDLPVWFPFETSGQVPMDRLSFAGGAPAGLESPVSRLFLVNEESDPGDGIWGAFAAAEGALDAWSKLENAARTVSGKRLN